MGTLSLKDYEEVSISVPWGHLSGKWYGNRKERPILAIHGLEDNLGTFDQLIPLLPDYFGVLCIDLPGHGYSSRMPPGIFYDFLDWVLVIPRVMREYKWSKVSLLGHSLGSVLSSLYACLAPDTVDLIIGIDGVLYWAESPEFMARKAFRIDKFLEEEERNTQGSIYEPTSYTLDNISTYLSKVTYNSVPKDLAHHVLKRGIAKSELYPDKVYVAKDARVKYTSELFFYPELCDEMARRITKIPHLIIKGTESPYMDEKDLKVLAFLGKQNPQFQFHEAPSKHHVHISNAEDCAKVIVPFLKRYRSFPGENVSLLIKHKL